MGGDPIDRKGPPLRKGGPRVRNYAPHVRSGCKTCKVRRVKCDETKPLCNRCTSTGRECDGYLYGPSAKSHISPFSKFIASSTSANTMIVPARTHIFINTIIPPNPFSNSQEHRGFAFFQRHTYSRLSPSFHSKFWDQLVLQACHHEPPVRHAVVALGSLHESFMLGGGGGSGSPGGKKESSAVSRSSSDTFAVKQYTNAIRLLTASPEKWSGDVTLMACVLFVYFESLRGDHAATVSHIKSGKNIIAEQFTTSQASNSSRKRPDSSMPYISLRELAHLFIRLDGLEIELRALNTLQTPEDSIIEIPRGRSVRDPNVPSTFDTLEQARLALENIRLDSSPTANDPDPPKPFIPELYASSTQSAKITQLRQYTLALENFLHLRGNNLSPSELHILHLIKLRIILTSTSITTSLAHALKDECAWYDWGSKCKEMMAYAEKVVKFPEVKLQPLSGLEEGVIWILCFVGVKCTGEGMGMRAIALLREREWREGVWSSFLAADVVGRFLEGEDLRGEGGGE